MNQAKFFNNKFHRIPSQCLQNKESKQEKKSLFSVWEISKIITNRKTLHDDIKMKIICISCIRNSTCRLYHIEDKFIFQKHIKLLKPILYITLVVITTFFFLQPIFFFILSIANQKIRANIRNGRKTHVVADVWWTGFLFRRLQNMRCLKCCDNTKQQKRMNFSVLILGMKMTRAQIFPHL